MIRSGVNEDNELVNSETKITDVDLGFAKPFGGTLIPPGYLYCDGSEVSRQAYDKLFAAIGTTWGEGDGENTFNLPDLRGIFVRCDGGENNAAIGVRQGDAIREISGNVGFRPYKGLAASSNATLFTAATGAFAKIAGSLETEAGEGPQGVSYAHVREELYFNASNVVPTAAEVRPVNVAMKYCIRYE